MNQVKISQLKQSISPFEKPELKTSVRQLANTLVPLLFLWYAAYASLSYSYWITLPLTFIIAGFLVRTFIIFHDCCHHAFFKNSKANDILGMILGVITLFPYQQWKHSHSIHHATSGNLDKRGTGDIWLLTIQEYCSAPLRTKLFYRMYRHPFVMFLIGPIAVFLLKNRFNRKTAKRKERLNTFITNASVIALYAVLTWVVGWEALLMIQGPAFLISGLLGVWLFYVQHQFEDSYYEKDEEWSFVQAAIDGSSYYKLPKPLQWITGNIGFHHVHHLCPKVPNYNLEKAHHASPPLQKVTTVTLGTSFKSIHYHLWDETNHSFVSFRDLRNIGKTVDQ
ncbi:fatty acid desaturase [Paenibacillus sp. OV219]|uniref:fatty acid desaturase n=1 Tax=Paenibacillus sp. OV219 TaxID=1884377 RepID=UPI0008D164FF|nr:fatty acid desaturase [Paenibacillus sp. OV219]SEM54899.1 omega-6 fatty acid desaturase (delta-12 desaturase) [Paenibacillus sp. OV219]